MTECMARRGFSVAPPLDVSSSRHYGMSDLRLLEWRLHMIESVLFGAFLFRTSMRQFLACGASRGEVILST